jgi:hypothetical protein
MEFTVEFYETMDGHSPVREFLEELRQSDPGDHAVVMRGLAKLRNRQKSASFRERRINHRERREPKEFPVLLSLRSLRFLWFQ